MSNYTFSLSELIGQKLSPLQAALQASVDLMSSRFSVVGPQGAISAPLLAHRGEVDANGALFGAIAAFGHAINDRLGEFKTPGQIRSVGWAQYTNVQSGATSEPQRGGDFALILDLGNNRCRLAIFQAKVAKWTRRGSHIELTQSSGPRVQLVQLAKTAVAAQLQTRGSCNWSDLNWVHYLAWGYGTRPATVPLSGLGSLVRHALTFSESAGEKDEMPAEVKKHLRHAMDWASSPLDSLLRAGTQQDSPGSKPSFDCKGWLELDYAQAAAIAPPLLKLMDVAVLHDPNLLRPEYLRKLARSDVIGRIALLDEQGLFDRDGATGSDAIFGAISEENVPEGSALFSHAADTIVAAELDKALLKAGHQPVESTGDVPMSAGSTRGKSKPK